LFADLHAVRIHEHLRRYLPALLTIALVACLDDFEKLGKIETPLLDPWVDAPLGYATFSAAEFLTEGESKVRIVEKEGVLTLTYDNEISSPSLEKYFQIPNQQSPSIVIPASELTFLSSNSDTVTRDYSFEFTSANGERLDSIWMNTGQIVVETNSTLPLGVQLSFTTPTLELNGVPFKQDIDFRSAGSQTITLPLDNHTFDLTLNGTTKNTVSCTITAIFTNTGQTISPDDKVTVRFSLNNIRFRALFGQLGTYSFETPVVTMGLDVLAGLKSKNFVLLSPSVTIETRNSFGLPLAFDIVNLTAINSDSTVFPLTGAAVSPPLNPHIIAAPNYAQLGQSVTSNITISGENSNLGTLIGALPSYLSFGFGATLNPGTAVPQNFILDTSRVRIGIHAELPFHGRAQEISYSKRISFTGIGVVDNVIDSIPDVFIKMRTSNEFPFEARVQAYFLSESGAVIDSLLSQRTILKAAAVDAAGFSKSASDVVILMPLSQERIDRIDKAKQIEITAAISTTNNGAVPVKVSASNQLKVVVGLHTRVRNQVN
jgi:hypothetical protein